MFLVTGTILPHGEESGVCLSLVWFCVAPRQRVWGLFLVSEENIFVPSVNSFSCGQSMVLEDITQVVDGMVSLTRGSGLAMVRVTRVAGNGLISVIRMGGYNLVSLIWVVISM